METVIDATKRYGGHCQIAFCYTTSPIHTVEYFVEMAKKIETLAPILFALRICPACCFRGRLPLGLATESQYRSPVELHRIARPGRPRHLHEGDRGGRRYYRRRLAAIQRTSQPPTESFQYMLRGTQYDPGLNLDRFNAAAEKIKLVRDKYFASGVLNPKALMVNPLILQYQLPEACQI